MNNWQTRNCGVFERVIAENKNDMVWMFVEYLKD